MLVTALSFIFVLGVLIFIHELGHFIVAKRVGIRVETFSLGFPPTIASKKYGETTYALGIIPLGGYVKMAGENPDDKMVGAPDEFMSKSVAQRAAVIFAGPFMNYLLAIVILIGVFYFTGRPIFDESHVIVGQVVEGDPAYKAGLKTGDQIVSLDGKVINNYDSLRFAIYSHKDLPLTLSWLHDGDTMSARITPRIETVPNAEGGIDSIGMIGFSEKILGYHKYGLWESAKRGFVTAHVIVYETVLFVKKFAFGEVSPKLIGGPIFIAQQSGREAEKGPSNLFFFMALLSVNLAILNVLPIPILDGGHLVFLAAEKIKGSPLSMKTRAIAQQVGLIFLLFLIVFVTYNDILRAFKGF